MSINTCMIVLFFIPKHSCNSRLQNGSHAQPLRFRLLFGLGWFFLSQRSPRSCFHQKPLVENPLPLSQLVEHSILELLTVEFSNTRPQMVSLISPSPHQQGNILNIELTIFMEFFFFLINTWLFRVWYRSKAVCDGTTNLDLGPICGRTFGLALHYATRQLYIADAYSGLLVDGPNGRLATQLATGAEGQAFHFLDGLDVDQGTGVVYFTDASGVYDFRF